MNIPDHDQRRTLLSESGETDRRILVALGVGANAKSVLEAAHEHAAQMGAQLFAVSVETPDVLSTVERQTRSETLNLARQLGAELILASGSHAGRVLLRIAIDKAASLLILGAPRLASKIQFWSRNSPALWLQRNNCGIRLLLVPTNSLATNGPERSSLSSLEPRKKDWKEYAGACVMVAASTALGWFLAPVLGYWSVALIYLLTVTLTGVSFGRGPTLMLATLSAALWDLVFIPPRGSLYISRSQDIMMFAMFFAVALAVGHLTAQLRSRERMEHRMELRARALYQLTRQLAAATSIEDVIFSGCHQIEKVFQTSSAIALRNAEGNLSNPVSVSEEWSTTPAEIELMRASFLGKGPLEADCPHTEGSRILCLPLLVAGGVEGVLGLRIPSGHFLDANHRDLLDAFASQLGIASEIQRLAGEQRNSRLLAESARLQKTLFDSVSHELKTPIAAIRVALEQPMVDGEEIRRATDRLHRAVEQLLSATRLESGLLKPIREWCDPLDLANEAIVRSRGGERVSLIAADPLPLVRVDAVLVIQALITLLENALTHGASRLNPEFIVSADSETVRFEVADRGTGIPVGLESKVFEKFYRLPGARAGGIGLGLAIAKQFAELLGGELRACNREGGGASFFLTLPVGGKVLLPA